MTLSNWSELQHHHQSMQSTQIHDLFATQPDRAHRFSLAAAGLWLDYSKNRITSETMTLLFKLAQQRQLSEKIIDMFSGKIINHTEHRPALHVALRAPENHSAMFINGSNVMPTIHQQLHKMQQLVEQIHGGQWLGYSGKKITDVVNIGIGGSDLGPRMIVQALQPYHLGVVHCHFVANVDGADISRTLQNLNPETTLFIVASKSFTTQETLINAETARDWLLKHAKKPAAVSKHFVAISSKPDKAKAFGIDPNNVFEMWDWVGGRYSLWSTIGMPIAFSIGMAGFRELLAGAHAMDQHFLHAPLEHNMPVILGALAVWYVNYFNCQSQAVIAYDESLSLLPNYLQQLDMESNGKSVTQQGVEVQQATAPILWGGVGTNGQHAFHQLLHQGTVLVPVDFILPHTSHYPIGDHHAALYANCLAQSQALMQGKSLSEAAEELRNQGMSADQIATLAPHKAIPGNKPSNTLMMEKLTPKTLGALIALYEHKVYVQSVLWQINAFDQWGVELGKQLGTPIFEQLIAKKPNALKVDCSTQQLIKRFHAKIKPWVIIDRDGVINHDSDAYIKNPDEWQPIDGSLEAIVKLNQAGITVTVATNQAGLARGLFDEITLQAMHDKMHLLLKQQGGQIDAVVFCPHHPDQYCHCRKPNPGLLQQLSEKLNLSLAHAVFVGDSYKDIEAARRAGARFALVKTGKGEKTLAMHPELLEMPDVVYDSLAGFVKAYLEKL